MASIAAIAARVRPTWPGVLLLATIAIVPWAEQHQNRAVSNAVDAFLAGRNAPTRPAIVLTPWDRVELGPQHFEILVPPKHPDAQPWPRGMVIGLNTPSVDPQIQRWFDAPFANVLSVLVAPWQALAYQLGA